jgi:hypothetical protein
VEYGVLEDGGHCVAPMTRFTGSNSLLSSI